MLEVCALAVVAISAAAVLVRIDLRRRRLRWVWQQQPAAAGAGRGWARALRRLLGLALLAAVLLAPLAGVPPAWAQMCDTEAPRVENPGEGISGALDPPIYGNSGTSGTPLGDYSYAGQTWHTYDLGCVSNSDTQLAEPATALAEWLFSIAKVLIAATNGLHYALEDPETFGWVTALIKALAPLLYSGVFAVWVGLALLLLAVILLWHGAAGDNAGTAKRAGWGLVGLWLAAACTFAPLTYHNVFEKTVYGLASEAQAGFLDANIQRYALPDALSQNVIYPSWLTGEFGDPHGTTAQTHGPRLLAAQACSKYEIMTGSCDRRGKQADFTALAAEIKTADPGAYAVFTGRESKVRLSAGTLAIGQAAWLSCFQIVAKAVLAAALITTGLLVLLAPVAGLLGMLNPATLRHVFRTAGGALLNALLAGLLGGLHVRMILLITGSTMSIGMQALAMILATWILLLILRPVKRMRAMLDGALNITGESMTSSSSGLGRTLLTAMLLRGVRGGRGGRGSAASGTDSDDATQWYKVQPDHRVRMQSAASAVPEAFYFGDREANGADPPATAPSGSPAVPQQPSGPGSSTSGLSYRAPTAPSAPSGASEPDPSVHATKRVHAYRVDLPEGGAEPAARTVGAGTAAEPTSAVGGDRNPDTPVSGGPHRRELPSGQAESPPSSPPPNDPRPAPSSFGMADTPEVYRPDTTDETASPRTVLDADRDTDGAWRVRGDDAPPAEGES